MDNPYWSNSLCIINKFYKRLYNDVTEVLEACPLVTNNLLDILSSHLEDQDDKVLIVMAKLLQSFLCTSKKSNLFTGCTPQLISKIMERVSILHFQSPHISNLQYQFSLYVIEVNRRYSEQPR